jgi:hypothetical protein
LRKTEDIDHVQCKVKTYDQFPVLGKTLEGIAWEKGGVYVVGKGAKIGNDDENGSRLAVVRDDDRRQMGLHGNHQQGNAVLALAMCRHAASARPDLPTERSRMRPTTYRTVSRNIIRRTQSIKMTDDGIRRHFVQCVSRSCEERTISLKIPNLFLALTKSSKAPFVRDDIKLLTSQEWAVIEKDVHSENGRRAKQGAVRSVANQMELETGVMPTLKKSASELGRTSGQKSVGKPKGNAVWAKVVQISGSDKEIQGTEKCADTKQKICAELCHQGISLSFATCSQGKYIGKWFKYAGESADSSTIIFHSNKRWKLTILTAKPTDVEEVCDKMYLKESKSLRKTDAKKQAIKRSIG